MTAKGCFSLVRRQLIIDDYPAVALIQRRYQLLKPVLDERHRRLWAAAEALALGAGGIALLSRATGLSRTTVRAGIEDLRGSEKELADLAMAGRVRRPGAGRKSVVELDATLEADLEALLESFQDADHVLDWTCKSIRGLAGELASKGHQVSYRTVGNLLHRMGFRFSPADSYRKFILAERREQFHRLSRHAALFLENGEPVVAVGFTDQTRHQIVAPDAKTADLAASALRHWADERARTLAHRRMLLLLDTAGLPIGDRSIWTPLLQPLVDGLGMKIDVNHFPPGARRWQRSTRELTCSYSRPVNGTDQSLTIELEQILPSGSEARQRTGVFRGARESYDGFWNYRIESRSRGSVD